MPPRPPKNEDERRAQIVGVRFTAAELERLDRLGDAMRTAMPGFAVNRATVIRSAVATGLDYLEEEYGLAKRQPRRQK